ncbi:hypothetical protein FAVG1_03112 [Fusarium avenaceum]|nr:hypothetical protein FAVG1_03112 [Fusarium avenaceum]
MPSDALDRIHPDLVDLMIRFQLLPPRQSGYTEDNLARICNLAIELADPDEQALLVSRIIPEEELALERLRSPEVRDLTHRVVLDRAERKAALEEHEYVPTSGLPQDCLICTETAHLRIPCGCYYCVSCFRMAICRGLRSQEEFPPRCCKPFNDAVVAFAGSPALVHLFRQMKEEADTPIHDRLYCYNGHCAAFIPPDCKGKCLLCHRKTCVECFEKAHPDRPCEQGDAEEDVWAMMDKNKTVNCPGCGRMVELLEACNHMTCVCGKQFCYLCGNTWLSCNCPPYGHFHRMVPMKDRPGVKPPQFRRRRQHHTEESASENAPVRIPQLRPRAGEENRVPAASATRKRVVRPLVLPQRIDRQHERERQQRQRQREQAPELVQQHPLRVRERLGIHGRRNAVELLQGDRFVAQQEPREANRPNDAHRHHHHHHHHHHHRRQRETQLIPVDPPAPLAGMHLGPVIHGRMPANDGAPGLMVPRRLIDRHQNNPRHQHDDSRVARELEQGIQVEQATQGQPPVRPRLRAASERDLDPAAEREQDRRQLALATRRMRQVNRATQQRLNDMRDEQNQQSGQQSDAEDSEELHEDVLRSIYNRFYLGRD